MPGRVVSAPRPRESPPSFGVVASLGCSSVERFPVPSAIRKVDSAMSAQTHDSMFDINGLGRSFFAGATIGFTSTFVLTLVLTLLVGIDLGVCLGIATFTSAWAGVGLGGMFGAIRSTHRLH